LATNDQAPLGLSRTIAAFKAVAKRTQRP
jgi:hypothetical protein